MGFQQRSLTRADGGIRHARSRSAYPPMFTAPDILGGLDRFGMVYLATIVITREDLSRDEDICPLSTLGTMLFAQCAWGLSLQTKPPRRVAADQNFSQ